MAQKNNLYATNIAYKNNIENRKQIQLSENIHPNSPTIINYCIIQYTNNIHNYQNAI